MKNTILPLGIASVLQQILNDGIKDEVKGVVNYFVFPIIDAVLLVVLIVQLVRTYKDWKEHSEIQYEKPLIVGICLVIAIVAPRFMWGIIGW